MESTPAFRPVNNRSYTITQIETIQRFKGKAKEKDQLPILVLHVQFAMAQFLIFAPQEFMRLPSTFVKKHPRELSIDNI